MMKNCLGQITFSECAPCETVKTSSPKRSSEKRSLFIGSWGQDFSNQSSVEVKAISKLAPIHTAQILSYLRLAKIERGLLINFHSYALRDGIKRFSLTRQP